MYKVILVDDEPYMLTGLKALIPWKQLGFEIIAESSNSTQALDLIRMMKPDILITDIKMPKLSGLEMIHMLKESHDCPHVIILSGYNDFDYVKEALKLGIDNYLLKPINEEELVQTLFSIVDSIESTLIEKERNIEESNILKHNILSRWITGTISPSELEQRAPLLHLDLESEVYSICLLRILNASQNEHELRQAIIQLCHEQLTNLFHNEIYCDFTGDILFFFSGNRDDLSLTSLHQLLENCIRDIHENLQTNVFVSIGTIVSSFEELNKSYLYANNLMEYTLTFEPNQIIDNTTISFDLSSSEMEINIQPEYFEGLLLSGSEEKALSHVDAIFQTLFSNYLTSPHYIKKIIVDLLYTINDVARKKKAILMYQDASIDELYHAIYQTNQKAQLIDIIKGTCLQVMKPTEETSSSHPLVQQIINYISDNLSKDISLKLLAADFNMNPSYLGQLFKSETGELFTNYLNYTRIQRSMQLLTESKLTASEIAIKVGYPNTNYFYSCFKKYTGKYPTEYRREVWLSELDSSY